MSSAVILLKYCIKKIGFLDVCRTHRCASGCVVECRICSREVAGSNLSMGFFAARSTQPSIPPGSVNEYHTRLGRQRQEWLTPIADERVGVQVKCEIPRQHVPYLSASAVVIHYEGALYQVYAPYIDLRLLYCAACTTV